jgi:hypothetical protein
MASMPRILMVVDTVAPVPLLAAGLTTGAGLWLACHSVPRAYSLDAFSRNRGIAAAPQIQAGSC